MKLLVTGGAGFIGSNFIRYWLKKYPRDKIINLDKLTYAGHPSSTKDFSDNSNYKFVKGDILNHKLVNNLVNDVDYLVHFAAESHVDRSILGPAVFVQTNVLGTQVLLDAAVKNKIKRFHYISTDEVFGDLEIGSKEKFNESTPLNPHSPYSASKAGSDLLVLVPISTLLDFQLRSPIVQTIMVPSRTRKSLFLGTLFAFSKDKKQRYTATGNMPVIGCMLKITAEQLN